MGQYLCAEDYKPQQATGVCEPITMPDRNNEKLSVNSTFLIDKILAGKSTTIQSRKRYTRMAGEVPGGKARADFGYFPVSDKSFNETRSIVIIWWFY